MGEGGREEASWLLHKAGGDMVTTFKCEFLGRPENNCLCPSYNSRRNDHII